ncbi:uncharacterized protein OCT59_010503 [Rhizophagus irregularis]|uniref:Meiotically up-regulated protein Msb1/Mug8 domain-containing protein n=3 Tax=Rhizophagus irregularis TaxID=588596 RepID=A0A015K2J9_RHIIW|nr:hypothetical protein RirG_036770 [Rhizophagus irregularis DAOM 197198w]UZO19204.1 hypothetical protein OCT59_010503 [Rhizophagus irregularis]GBC29921.1 hypothetical protein GLOIN_2v1591493 [Rhizophagus irregularis DAOM 181602=DAOM 197198]CAG8435543.1 10792_t:CDS:2 [Rhizophagus irregularis]
MSRSKSASIISSSIKTNSNFKPLKKKFSLFSFLSEKRSIKKKQKRDVEQSITIGETYLIVHLYVNELVKRGLTDPNIFGPGPVQTDNENDEVRFLINCLLRDNRVEFEEELKYQSINNIIIGIRMALRNCTSIIISYENYEDFVKHEIEWQYDPKIGSFNQFLSYLPYKNQGILVELFDFFAMTMEVSHINHVHPRRILKSMSLHLFNESLSKSYENFHLAYQDWLKYSNALTHLFLAYMRERSYSTNLPDRLNILLKDYVECREKCIRNSVTNEYGNEIIFKEHILPDITMENLDDAIISMEQFDINPIQRSSMLKRNVKKIQKKISRRFRNSFYPTFPEKFILKRKENIKPSSFPNITKIDDPETVEIKWDELQSRGLYILSEEALKLLFIYDNFRFTNFENRKNKKIEKNERYNISGPLEFINDPINNDVKNVYSIYSVDNENIECNDFIKEEFHDSIISNSNIFSSTSTLNPSDNGTNSTTIEYNKIMTSNEIEERKKIRTCYKLSCFKCHEINYSSWGDWNWDGWQNIEKSNYLSHDNLTKSQQHYLEDDEQLYENFQQNDDQYQYQDDYDEKASQSCQSDQSVFERYSVIRGKEFPYPLTPTRSNRQSPIPGSRGSLFNRQIRVASQIPNLINTDRIEEIVEIIINHNLNNNNLQQITESETIIPYSSINYE